jgi:hypothetical protein
METMEWFKTACEPGTCSGRFCADSIKTDHSGRWYITMGHPGFNSPANNRMGYASRAKAEAARRHYAERMVRP